MNQQELLATVLAAALALGAFYFSEAFTQRIRPRLRTLAEKFGTSLEAKPWLFEPIAVADLPSAHRKFFETHTAGFLARGFTQLGDFLLRRESPPSIVRFFLSPDGATIGELNHYQGTATIGCMSVLLDGLYLESATLQIDTLPPIEHGLQFFTLQTDDSRELIDHHMACAARLAAERGTQCTPLAADDAISVANYGRRLSMQSLHLQGFIDNVPEFMRARSPAFGPPST